MGVPDAVAGSMGCSCCGEDRLTGDVDILADLRSERVPEVLKALPTNVFDPGALAVPEAIDGRSQFAIILPEDGSTGMLPGWWDAIFPTQSIPPKGSRGSPLFGIGQPGVQLCRVSRLAGNTGELGAKRVEFFSVLDAVRVGRRLERLIADHAETAAGDEIFEPADDRAWDAVGVEQGGGFGRGVAILVGVALDHDVEPAGDAGIVDRRGF